MALTFLKADKCDFSYEFYHLDNSWSAVKDGKEVKFMTFVDDNHVKMFGSDAVVELSQAGAVAYKAIATGNTVAFAE